MKMHQFKLQPKWKPLIHIISGAPVDNGKFIYSCKKCDSKVELETKVPEIEVNKYFSDPAQRFPCINVNQK